jgi:acyl-coenzyme A thioesterase PaaI-like protein
MSVPEGWSLLDVGARLGMDKPEFMGHVGPLYTRDVDGMPQIGFEVLQHMCNPAGICHGGMMMTVMDVGLAFILHARLGGAQFTPSVSFNFDFLAPGELGNWLETSGQCTQNTKRTGFVSGLLTGPNGPVMSGSGIFKITNRTIS